MRMRGPSRTYSVCARDRLAADTYEDSPCPEGATPTPGAGRRGDLSLGKEMTGQVSLLSRFSRKGGRFGRPRTMVHYVLDSDAASIDREIQFGNIIRL